MSSGTLNSIHSPTPICQYRDIKSALFYHTSSSNVIYCNVDIPPSSDLSQSPITCNLCYLVCHQAVIFSSFLLELCFPPSPPELSTSDTCASKHAKSIYFFFVVDSSSPYPIKNVVQSLVCQSDLHIYISKGFTSSHLL